MAASDAPRVIEKIETEKTEKDKTDKKEEARPVPAPTTVEPPRPEDRVARKEERLPKEDRGALKLSKKERKRIKDSHRPLDSWERYRALTDTLDEALELVDLADHKARFALIIMTAVNGVLFLLGTRTSVFELAPPSFRPAMAVFVAVYGAVAVYFFLQAIESLRPRKSKPQVQYTGESMLEDYPMGIRYYEDILSRDVEAYRRAWREVRMGQLNAELTIQAHALAQINRAKYAALRRLYFGLQLMTIMATALVALSGYFAFRSTSDALAAPGHHKKSGEATQVLPEPERVATAGVKEPSGVAYHSKLGHLFVVGDEGKLAELDGAGNVLKTHKVHGDLEDVAVHTPSGNLVLLSEKKSDLIWYDPVAGEEKKSWHLAPETALGQAPIDKNQGFEGLAFREDAGSPGGGIFYLTHQRSPGSVVAVAFDPATQPNGPLGAEVVKEQWPLKGYSDLTAATWVGKLERLLVIADSRDELLIVGADGKVERVVALPGGGQQEGLCVDDKGDLWVADDRGGLARFRGALTLLEASLTEDTRSKPEPAGRASAGSPAPPIP
ncbi:MAG TPA: SdiA-regulated domain-containing protein [Vicinamibacteria bacterium]